MFAVIKNDYSYNKKNIDGIVDETEKYIIDYSNQMRYNIKNGRYIFEGISESYFTDNNSEQAIITYNQKNAALAEIFINELSYLNMLIQLISLVSSRYLEEKEDDDENYRDIPMDELSDRLSSKLLKFSGNLYKTFFQLCDRIGLDIILVNKMLINDSISMKRSNMMTCILPIIERIGENDWEMTIQDFEELCELSKFIWKILSLLSFANLYRLMEGSEFELFPINPDDAIFANHGYPFPDEDFKIGI